MTIKIRLKEDKVVIRWKNPMEKQFLKHQLTVFRDNMKNMNISLKDEKGDEVPRLPKQVMPPFGPMSGQTPNNPPQVIPMSPPTISISGQQPQIKPLEPGATLSQMPSKENVSVVKIGVKPDGPS